MWFVGRHAWLPTSARENLILFYFTKELPMKFTFAHWAAALLYVLTWLGVNMALATAFAFERASGGLLTSEARLLVSALIAGGMFIVTVIAMSRYKPFRLMGVIVAFAIEAFVLGRMYVVAVNDAQTLANELLAWMGVALLCVLLYLIVSAPLEWDVPQEE